MNYIVFDLEFNQKYKNNEELVNNDLENIIEPPTISHGNLTFEIIQIGAVKFNKNFEKISTFNSLVKPVIHKTLHPYVENMTKINIDEANMAEEFPEVFEKFLKFIGTEDSVFCVWGFVDIKELLNNISYFGLSPMLLPSKYIDIQYHASKVLNYTKGTRVGLKSALELLGLENEGNFHDALKDAYYTSLIFKKLYNGTIKAQEYNLNPKDLRKKRDHKIKLRVDNLALIKQFEKMYNRKMTKEEVEIIKTAYTMGKTQQFLISKDKDS